MPLWFKSVKLSFLLVAATSTVMDINNCHKADVALWIRKQRKVVMSPAFQGIGAKLLYIL